MKTRSKDRVQLRVSHLAAASVLLALGACGSASYTAALRDPSALPSNSAIVGHTNYAASFEPGPPGPMARLVAERIDELKQAPMTEQAAVEIALLNDPTVQQTLKQLDGGEGLRSDLRVARELASLQDDEGAGIAAPEWLMIKAFLAQDAASAWRRDFATDYLDVAALLVDKAAATRKRYIEAVAAAELAGLFEQMEQGSGATALLANEQFRSGTLSRLGQADRQLAHAENVKGAIQARQASQVAHEALLRQLHLYGDQTTWNLSERLPDLPKERPAMADPERIAVAEGLEALIARREERAFGRGAHIRSYAREAYATMLNAYDLARYQRDVVLPLVRVRLEEAQLHYNAMLEDVYHLIEASHDHIEASKDYVEALAGFWIARTELTRIIGGRDPSLAPPGPKAPPPTA